MKAVIQRVKSASVTVDGELVSKIGRGLLVLAGVGRDDTERDIDTMITRILKARLFPGDNDAQARAPTTDIDGEVLCVSQFTLFGQLKKGKQPDFHEAAKAEVARSLYDYFYRRLSETYKPERVKNGVFQAMMDVELINDGPVGVDYRSEDAAVTIEIDTQLPKKEKIPGDGKGETSTESKAERVEFQLPASLLE
ncbi:COG1490 domain protein [Aspergillus ochraceoroseus]|uniref:D-aminoacyl-tRNA deacylase n=1 Tax=Aspergillus ochraceoroseus TaxID=138278 RepID=A0A0F8V1T6_9EURO|nr:COG1490 domain protein [Aspergillus ochraceoroseus]